MYYITLAGGPVQLSDKQQEAISILASYLAPSLLRAKPPSLTEFSSKHFFIPETNYPLQLMPHQSAILEYAFDPKNNFQTIVYSTIKKSGKTAIGALVGRWVCETWGNSPEVLLCVAYNTLVKMANGKTKRIWEIVRDKDPGPVLSFNVETGQLEPKRVINWYKSPRKNRPYIGIKGTVSLARGEKSDPILWVTYDHKILTKDGYKAAIELRDGDLIATRFRQPSPDQMSIICGTLLGDGYLNYSNSDAKSGFPALVMLHSAEQVDYLQLKVLSLEGLGPRELRYNKNRNQYSWSSYANPSLIELKKKFYPSGRKVVPRDLIEKYFSPLLLTTWFLDDGTSYYRHRTRTNDYSSYGLLATLSFSKEDVEWLCELLNKHKLFCNVYKTSYLGTYGGLGIGYNIHFSTEGFKNFIDYIYDYIPPVVTHKFIHNHYIGTWVSKWSLVSEPYYDSIKIVTDGAPNRDTVFCIEVEDNHNFSALNYIVKNCANDYEQARGRIYEKIIESIRLTPGYLPIKRELPGKWKIVERHAIYHPNNGVIRSVSGDYKGEAGSNPSISIFSELWAYESEASRRLWEELTPVPTRDRSIRFVETYAGYADSSDLLLDLYKLGKNGVQLTHDDLDWPFEDRPPIWVNKNARLFMYWDDGLNARRMPWQSPEYYAAQEQILRPQAFRRLHLNEWTSSVSPFIPIEWWINCSQLLPPLDSKTPVVIGADAAVSSDCCALVGVTRNPRDNSQVAVRFSNVWYPPPGGVINLTETMEVSIREYCKKYNVVQIAYDEYQLHKLMTDLSTDNVVWCRKFSQQTAREIADKQLYDVIRDRKIVHNGDVVIADHLKNAAAKTAKEEDTKLRIVKKSSAAKIDLAVALSMAVSECLRLVL